MKSVYWLAIFLPAVAVCAHSAGADKAPLAPQRGVLLLTNGELIEGTIMPAGDRYDVHLADGEIRVRRSQVALVARDARECYLHKRSGIEFGRAQDYLDLAEWCLRNNLTDEAAKEIAQAKQVDAAHPKIPLLEARLGLAVEKPAAHEPAKHDEAKPAARSLDAVLRNLPAGSVESFTNSVQPLLLNFCARAGCHGPQSTGAMRLERIPPNRFTGRKSTQRNLSSVLAMIDREKPEHSKLLVAPVGPHGGSNLPIFTDRRQSQYRQLVQWVYHVVGDKLPAAPPTLKERTAPLLEQGPQPGDPPSDAAPDEPVAAEGATVVPPSSAPGATAGLSSSVPQSELMRRLQSPTPSNADSFVPKDPFDPEIFNRRFFGSK